MNRIPLLVALGLLSFPAYADNFVPAFDDVCFGPPGGLGSINQRALLGVLLKGLDDISLEQSGADVGYREKVAAIIDPEGFCATHKCADGVKDKLGIQQILFSQFLEDSSKPLHAGKPGYSIRARGNKGVDLRTFFQAPGTYVAACQLPSKPAGEPSRASAGSDIPQRWAIRKNVEDLAFGQTTAGFKTAPRATFSYDRDFAGDTQSFSLNGTLGYVIGRGVLAPNVYGTIIPFVSYNQNYVSKAGVGSNKIFNIAAGVTGDVLFPAFGMYNDLQFYPKFLYSPDTGTEIASGNFVYSPEPAFKPIGRAASAFSGRLWYQASPQIRIAYSKVLDSGGNANLPNDFVRIGPRLGMTIAGDQSLAGLALNASYEAYWMSGGPETFIKRFEASLSYTFPQTQLWALQLTYVNGRNLDTLQQQNEATFGLGLKY